MFPGSSTPSSDQSTCPHTLNVRAKAADYLRCDVVWQYMHTWWDMQISASNILRHKQL